MENLHDIKLEEIYIQSKQNKDTYLCEDFLIYPENKEASGGYMIGIIEIRATPVAESEKIIKLIINTLKEKYYGQIISSPDPERLNLETIFEYALQKTNEALSTFIQISHVNFPIENLHYSIAVAKPNSKSKDIDIYFTHQGLIGISLLHKTKQNNFKLINVVDNTPKITETPDENIKFFTSTMSGKVYYHDTIFFCTEIFNNYLPPHKVNKIISTNDLDGGIDYFKSIINNVKNNSYLTYAAIFVKMEEKKPLNDRPISQKSIDRLIDTEKNTEKLLTPTFALNLRGQIHALINRFKGKKIDKELQGLKHSKKLYFGVLKYIFNALKILFALLTSSSQSLIKLFSKSNSFSDSEKKLGKKKLSKIWFYSMPILIIFLIAGIFIAKFNTASKKEAAIYTENLKQIQDNINNSQVNLIYKNENESLKLLKEAENATNSLPQNNKDRIANYTELTKQIENLKTRLLHIEKVIPKMVAETTLNNQAFNISGLIGDNNNFLVYGNNNTYFKLQNGQLSAPLSVTNGNIIGALAETEQYLYTDNGSLLLVKDDNSTEVKATISNAPLAWRLYNGNIYALNADKQVVKYPKTATGFDGPQTWLKDKKDADLSDATDISIDGNIYTLSPDGKMYKFYSGTKEDFTAPIIEPALTTAKQILTSLDATQLYVIEAKRVLIISKDGKLLRQLLFDTLPEDIGVVAINGKDEKLLLTAGNKIYEYSLK